MMDYGWLIVAFFFPLFPFSMVFMKLYHKLNNPWLKNVVILVWPMIGLIVINKLQIVVSEWLLFWAVFTSFFYALRSLAIKDFGMWTGFIAVSLWSVLWTLTNKDTTTLFFYILGFSLPLTMLVLLGTELQKRFGTMYAGLIGGIADSLPRLSRMLVIVVLAVIATPFFPGFFIMFASIKEQVIALPMLALALAVCWFFWTWSGIRLLQGLITGPSTDDAIDDLGMSSTVIYAAILIAIVLLGLFKAGGL